MEEERPGWVLCNECVKHGKLTKLKLPSNPYQKIVCPECGCRYHTNPELFGLKPKVRRI